MSFWTSNSKYEELVKAYEQQIETTHPNTVSSRRLCPCLGFTHECGWAASSVTYYEHRGPAL